MTWLPINTMNLGELQVLPPNGNTTTLELDGILESCKFLGCVMCDGRVTRKIVNHPNTE